jgi:hypothetical protein
VAEPSEGLVPGHGPYSDTIAPSDCISAFPVGERRWATNRMVAAVALFATATQMRIGNG